MTSRPARTLARAIVGALCLALAGCSVNVNVSSTPSAPDLTATELTAGIEPAASGSLAIDDDPSPTYDFTVDLLRACVADDPDKGAVISPVSVLSALALTGNGAAGQTLAQIKRVTGQDIDGLTDSLQGYAALADEKDSPLSLANSVWLRDSGGLSVSDDYLETCRARLGAQVFSAPFDQSTADDINAWVSANTDGMIPSIVDQIPDEAQLYLINALAFEDTWADPFDPGQTEEETFTREDGTERTAHMMHATEGLYLESDLATGFIKSYADGTFAFVGLLPREGTSISDLVSGLDGASLRSLLAPVDNTVVHVGLPRFELTYENGLANELQALGMTDAFDPELADFSPMGSSDDGPLYVGEVLHKTHMEVDEKGTRAAAATEVEMLSGASALSDPPQEREVILNRPFLFLIVDQRTETPVFIGTVMDV